MRYYLKEVAAPFTVLLSFLFSSFIFNAFIDQCIAFMKTDNQVLGKLIFIRLDVHCNTDSNGLHLCLHLPALSTVFSTSFFISSNILASLRLFSSKLSMANAAFSSAVYT